MSEEKAKIIIFKVILKILIIIFFVFIILISYYLIKLKFFPSSFNNQSETKQTNNYSIIKNFLKKDSDLNFILNLKKGSPINFGNKKTYKKAVIYINYACPHCYYEKDKIKHLIINNKNINFYLKFFPINAFSLSDFFKISNASICVFEQNPLLFWDFYDQMFQKNIEIDDQYIDKQAEQLDIDFKKFKTCLLTKKYYQQIKNDIEKSTNLNIPGTPSLIINKTLILGAIPKNIQEIITQSYEN